MVAIVVAMWALPGVLVGFAVAAMGLAFAITCFGQRRAVRFGRVSQAAAIAISTALLFAYIRSEETYFSDGRSRWDAHDNAHALTVLAIFLGITAAVGLLAARRPSLAVAAFLASAAVAVIQVLAVVANTGD